MNVPRAGALLGRRYVLSEPLGEGATAAVFRAHDRVTGRDVAVKIFRSPDAVALARSEHAVALDAVHPAIARALDVGRDGARVYLVLELAEGEAFDVALKGRAPDSLALALDELLSALAFIHGRGLVHGDLKPAHVRVRWEDGRPRARLLDLGLARPSGTVGGGNTAYGAPEAITGAATGPSDLFGVGAMMHEALTGDLPYGNPDDPSYLARLMAGERIAPPRALPVALAPIVERLLQHDPSARFRSALEVRAALRSAVPGAARATEPAERPPLLGRDALLERAARALADRDPAPMVLLGERGAGRSRVLSRVAAEARLGAFTTIEASARGGLRALLRAILEGAGAYGPLSVDEAARRAVEGDLSTPARTYAALFAVLDALSGLARRGDVLVAVDDVDASSADAVRFLAGAPGGAGVRWAIVGARVDGGLDLELAPLDADDVARLLGAMLPGLAGADTIAQAAMVPTGGLPGPVVDGVLRLVATGAVRFCETGWQASAEGLDLTVFEALSPAHIRAAIEGLGPKERRAAASAAIAGGSFEEGAERAGVARRDGRRAAGACARAGLSLTSDAVRAQLVECLDPAERTAIREAAVRALADAEPIAARSDRARHLAALGRAPEAAADAIATADLAGRAGLPAAAAELLALAAAWGGDEIARAVALPRAELRAAQGDVDGALAILDHAGDSDAILRARGRVLARAGRYDDAISALEGAARRPGASAEDRYWLGWSSMMRGRYDEAAALAREPLEDAGDRARAGRLRATIAWHRGCLDDAFEALSLARRDAEESGDPLVLVEVEQSLGTVERMRGRLDDAAVRFASAVRLARAHGLAAILAKCLNNLAINEYQAGRWDAAVQAWESMQELAARLGAREEVLLAHNNLALVHRDRGELARAEASLERALTLSRVLGIGRYEAMVLGNLAEVRTLTGALVEAERDLSAAEERARALGAAGELLECAVRRAALELARGDAHAALATASAAAGAAAACDAHLERGNAHLVAAAANRALSSFDACAANLRDAREALLRGGTRLEHARADLEDARLAAARGDAAAARVLARAAANVFADLGAGRQLAEARALEDQDEAVERAQALLELLRAASLAQDVDSLLERVVARVCLLTGAERGFVLLLDGERAPRIAARHGVEEGEVPRLSRGIADRVVASGRALVLANIGEELDLASRESVMGLGLRAALCAPLLRGTRCLGLLYVDSRCGPELVRFGLWMIDAAAAILVPALERLVDAELDRGRLALLRSSAMETLETLTSVDAALALLEDEPCEERRAQLAQAARAHVESAADRAERLLELLRVSEAEARDEGEAVDVSALLRAALTDAGAARLDVTGTPSVRGGLEPLSSLVAQMVSVVRSQLEPDAVLCVSARPLAGCSIEGAALPGTSGWRPGESAGRAFVRVEVRTSAPARRPEVLELEASVESLALRGATRLARRCGGRLVRADDADGFSLVAELIAGEGALGGALGEAEPGDTRANDMDGAMQRENAA